MFLRFWIFANVKECHMGNIKIVNVKPRHHRTLTLPDRHENLKQSGSKVLTQLRVLLSAS